MSKKHLTTEGKTDTWITPKNITAALGKFDLDPCAHTQMPWQHAKYSFTIKDDGLKQNWFGRVWLNPPFNRYEIDAWMHKMTVHKNGIMLVGAACETKRFYKYVYPLATGILMLKGRPKFFTDKAELIGNSAQTICLISFDKNNLRALINSKLGVVLEVNKKSL